MLPPGLEVLKSPTKENITLNFQAVNIFEVHSICGGRGQAWGPGADCRGGGKSKVQSSLLRELPPLQTAPSLDILRLIPKEG